jgi:hypothetical protein
MGIAASTSISTKSCGKEFTGFFTARGLHPSEGVGEPSENEIGRGVAFYTNYPKLHFPSGS